MARRCRRMVLLAFLTHVSLELCGFVGSWTAKSHSEKAQPTSVGVHAVDPAAAAALGAASSAISGFDFVGKRKAWFETQFAEVPLLASMSPEVKDHAERLLNVMRSQQTIIPQVVELPEQTVEGTGFQRLMITVLNDNRTGGLSAVHAEPGVGKSVAAALALRNCAQKSAVTVFLQRDFQKNLKDFFRVEDVADAVDVAGELFRILKQHGIRLQMVFDNTFDIGLGGQETDLLTLTRAAHEYDHHLIAVTQSEEAANKVAYLNGARTRLLEQRKAPSYRWSKGEAEEYLKEYLKAENAERVLNMTQVPDEVGGWKPVDIKEYLKTGRRPEAPQQGQGGRSTANSAVWVRQLQKDGDTFEQMGNAFPIDPVPSNIAYLKKAIKAEKPNKVKCDADEIDIFSQQDGSWIREDEEASVNRGPSKTDCYGFTLPSA